MSKLVFKAFNITFLSLLIGYTAIAADDVYNCPNGNTDINDIVIWDKEPFRPRLKKQKAYIKTSQVEYSCKIDYIGSYGTNWYLICNNGAHIWQEIPDIIVKDKNDSLYKMEYINSQLSVTCTDNEVIYKSKVTAYQKAFQFDIFMERTFERKLTPKPLGF